jgi:hypothetical protein
LCVHPPAAASLDEAYGAIEQWEFYSRKRLDDAQKLSVEHMLATRADRMWAARSTGRAVPRQNGKGEEIEVVEAWDLTQRAAMVVHTAHEIPTSTRAHLRMVGHLQSHRDLRQKVAKVRSSNSDRSIEMVNGGVIVYRTRTAGGGRGLDDISRLVVDEAQNAQAEQLAASTPILAVNPNPQTNFMGSAGIAGRSAQWWELRKRALAGDVADFAWLEHTAEQVSLVDGQVVSVRADSADVMAWIKANHGFPDRVPPEFLAEQLRLLGPELFGREHLCEWDPPPGELPSVFPPGAWEACSGARPDGLRVDALSVAVSYDLTRAAIGAAGIDGGKTYVKPLKYDGGTGWLIDRAKAEQVLHGVDVVVDGKGPAAVLIPALQDAGVALKITDTAEVLDACADLFNAVRDGTVRHESYPELDAAVSAAVKRTVGERWAWGRRVSTADISVLEAVTLAAWWAEHARVPAIY